MQLFQHHREQRVHVSLVREVSVALLGLDNEHDVGGRRDVTAVEPHKFAFGDLRVVGHVTPVYRAGKTGRVFRDGTARDPYDPVFRVPNRLRS